MQNVTNPTVKTHVVWLDVVRLIAMFTVVCCHCTDPLTVFSSRYSGLLCSKCAFHEKMTTIPVSPAAVYTMQYIISARVEKLYTFSVSDSVLRQLLAIMKSYRAVYLDHSFQTLKMLDGLFTG